MKAIYSNISKAIFILFLGFTQINCVNPASSQNTNPLQHAASPENVRNIQIALLLDTSNSMDGLIDQAKSQLWTVVNELSKAKCDNVRPLLQIALYEYGNDNLPSAEGYIRLVTPLTSDLDQISKDLFSLTTNGGDEFCGQAIETCLNRLNWSSSPLDLQMIFIAGNEPFSQGNVNYTEVCLKAKSKKVLVNTIFCGNFDEGISTSWKNGADLALGSYASIEQNKKTVYIESPYDRKISELNSRLNDTYIPYGNDGKNKKANQMEQDNNASGAGEVSSINRAVAKSSSAYKNETWDLVDASKQKGFAPEELKEAELPEEMRSMNDTQKDEYIKSKSVERENIMTEIQDLNQKRSAYIAEKQKSENTEITLDQAMVNVLHQQLLSRNFVVE